MVLNLGSIEHQGFVESVSGVRQRSRILRLFSTIPFFEIHVLLFFVILCATDAWFILCTNKIYAYVLKKSYFIFPITKGSVNALMKLAGFSTSSKVKNHCIRLCVEGGRMCYRSSYEENKLRRHVEL